MMVYNAQNHLRLALSKGPNRVGVSLPSHEARKTSGFRNVVFVVIYKFGRWTKSTDPVILTSYYLNIPASVQLLEVKNKPWEVNMFEYGTEVNG
jgi:hypothetical protein